MLRALTRFLDTGVPVIGANFGRVGFLTAIPGAELETGHRARLRGRVRGACRCRRSRWRSTASRHAAVNDAVVVSGTPGRIIEIEYSHRRRGPRHAAVRRPDLRDAARLDRLQPLERRPGARLGPRRGGGHVRRAAHAARAAARRRARTSSSRSSTARPTSRRSCSSTDAGRLPRAGEVARCASAPAGRCSRRCPSRRSSAATPRSSASTEAAHGCVADLWTSSEVGTARHRSGDLELLRAEGSAPTRVGAVRTSAERPCPRLRPRHAAGAR